MATTIIKIRKRKADKLMDCAEKLYKTSKKLLELVDDAVEGEEMDERNGGGSYGGGSGSGGNFRDRDWDDEYDEDDEEMDERRGVPGTGRYGRRRYGRRRGY